MLYIPRKYFIITSTLNENSVRQERGSNLVKVIENTKTEIATRYIAILKGPNWHILKLLGIK